MVTVPRVLEDVPMLNPQSPLAAIDLQHLDMALDELFFLPPPNLRGSADLQVQTIEELANYTKLSVAEVIARLERVRQLSMQLPLSVAELQEICRYHASMGGTVHLLDVRSPQAYAAAHWPGSTLLAGEDFSQLLPHLQVATVVVTICDTGTRAYSAALYLQQHGVSKVRYLAGGLMAAKVANAIA